MGECTSAWWVTGRWWGSHSHCVQESAAVSITTELWVFIKVANASCWVSMGVNWDVFYLQLC